MCINPRSGIGNWSLLQCDPSRAKDAGDQRQLRGGLWSLESPTLHGESYLRGRGRGPWLGLGSSQSRRYRCISTCPSTSARFTNNTAPTWCPSTGLPLPALPRNTFHKADSQHRSDHMKL